MNHLRWDDLKILLAIGRQGSLTSAAQILGIDQSTAGRRLSALEADLGAVLFVRSKSGFAATDAGEVAIGHALEVEKQSERMIDEVSNPHQGAVGTVRLVGNAWTLDRLTRHSGARFLAKNPRLNLRIVTLLPKNATRGESTLSLWFERRKRPGEFTIDLGKVPYAVYQHKDMRPENKNWVAFYDEDFDRPIISKTVANLKKSNETVQLTATDATLLYSAVISGIGKGLLPMCLAEPDPDLVRTTPGKPEFFRMMQLHLHPDNLETKRMQAAINWIRDDFSAAFSAVTP